MMFEVCVTLLDKAGAFLGTKLPIFLSITPSVFANGFASAALKWENMISLFS